MSLNSRHLFGTNGIRGVVNKDLTPQMTLKIGSAVGAFFKHGTLLVGHDARTSGPLLTQAVIAGLISTGCHVLFAGLMPTPVLQFHVKGHDIDGGVIVTASHNPPQYNGIKVFGNDGIELSREKEVEIENAYFENKILLADWNKLGISSELEGIFDEYLISIKKQVDVSAIVGRHFHIVVDAGNSVGAFTILPLLNELGCKVTQINTKIDGTFPGRPPEPRPEYLSDLASSVRTTHADLGVAYDSDADRAIFVDERGEIQMGDRSFALIEKFFLLDNPGEKIVTSISSSTMIKDIADEYGGEIVWTKIGSVTVSRTMKEINAKLGGEEYGGIFYSPHQPVRDGAMATALVLDIMAKTGRKLSRLLGALPEYFIEKGSVACPEQLKGKVLQKLIEQTKGLKTSTLDGLKLWFKDKSGILIRPSGTEPIYRLYAEAKTAKRVTQLIKEYVSVVEKTIEKFEA